MIPAKVLGENWVECTTSDQKYYANLKTKETRWDFPEELLSDMELVNHKDNWVEAVDVSLHKNYYYNRVTKVSLWQQPLYLARMKSNEMFSGNIFLFATSL